MKIIQPSVELIDNINPADIYNKIERCGRVSHQSESKGNPENFIRKIIKLGHESVLEHVSLTFHIITDRAIQNELVRHRHASFTVESSRYVKYDKFEVIAPPFEKETSQNTRYQMTYNDDEEVVFEKYPDTFEAWKMAVNGAENIYRFLITQGVKPEIARAVLPLCLKSELYIRLISANCAIFSSSAQIKPLIRKCVLLPGKSSPYSVTSCPSSSRIFNHEETHNYHYRTGYP